MKLFEFLLANWDSVLVIVAFIAACVILIKKGATKMVKQMLFYLVLIAEEQFGSGTGDLKYAAVVTWIYERLPPVVKFFLTSAQLDRLIEAAVAEMKDYLQSNESVSVRIASAVSAATSTETDESAK